MRYRVRYFIFFVLFMPFFMAFSFASEKAIQESPSAFFPRDRYKFNAVIDGAEVTHAFTIQNKGDAPLIINDVKTG